MPPHNFLLGHIVVVTRLLARLPSDAHAFYVPDQLRRNYPELGQNYYLDLWPFAPSMLVLGSANTVHQVNQEQVLQKYPQLYAFIRPLTDNLDILSMEGDMWKKWRAVFNPGFSAAHLMTLVPGIVKETEIFCQILREHAEKKDIFEMKALTDNLTMDVIGRVVL
jgi:sterigmatocystin biosynthesis cytochrome P450 monooxygenase